MKDFNDPRTLFALYDFPDPVENIEAYESGDTLDEDLDSTVGTYLNEKVVVDAINNEITLPKLMQSYMEDFGGNEESLLKFVWQYLQDQELDEETVIKEVCQKRNMMIRYE